MDKQELRIDASTRGILVDVGRVYLLKTKLDTATRLFETGGMTKLEFIEELQTIRSKLDHLREL